MEHAHCRYRIHSARAHSVLEMRAMQSEMGGKMSAPTQEERIVKALETIAAVLKTILEEGITIYTHESGPENRN